MIKCDIVEWSYADPPSDPIPALCVYVRVSLLGYLWCALWSFWSAIAYKCVDGNSRLAKTSLGVYWDRGTCLSSGVWVSSRSCALLSFRTRVWRRVWLRWTSTRLLCTLPSWSTALPVGVNGERERSRCWEEFILKLNFRTNLAWEWALFKITTGI